MTLQAGQTVIITQQYVDRIRQLFADNPTNHTYIPQVGEMYKIIHINRQRYTAWVRGVEHNNDSFLYFGNGLEDVLLASLIEPEMRLWLVSAIDSVGYDQFDGFVIRAESEEQAREFASKQDFRHTDWSSNSATCIELAQKGQAGVILSSFNAG